VTDSSSAAEEFQQLRPLLFSIAYNMTGSVADADAEDIVSEAFLCPSRNICGRRRSG